MDRQPSTCLNLLSSLEISAQLHIFTKFDSWSSAFSLSWGEKRNSFRTDPCYGLIGRVSPFTELDSRQPAISCWLSSQKCLLFVSLPLSNVRCSWTGRQTVEAGYLCRPVVMWNVIRTLGESGGGRECAGSGVALELSQPGIHFLHSHKFFIFILKSILLKACFSVEHWREAADKVHV